MKRAKKDAANFQQLNATQMGKVTGGGYWATFTTPDGQTKTVWVEV